MNPIERPSEPAATPTRGPSRFVSLSLYTVIATYALIAVGSLVRAAGAGLGCPDWPRCFGRFIPPTSADQLPAGFDPGAFNVFQTWLEYLNRLTGVTIGLLILATAFSAWRYHRRQPHILWPSIAALVLVVFQGWLGGQVVAEELADDVLTAHMVLALVIVGILVYAHLYARFGAAPSVPLAQRRLGTWGVGIGMMVLIQAGIGTRVRYAIDQLAGSSVPRSEWLPLLGWWPDLAHRQFALLLLAASIALVMAVQRRAPGHRGMLAWARYIAVLDFVQIAVGLGLAYGAVPRPLQVSHMLLGSLLLGAITVFVYQAYRVAPDVPTPTGNLAGSPPGIASRGRPL